MKILFASHRLFLINLFTLAALTLSACSAAPFTTPGTGPTLAATASPEALLPTPAPSLPAAGTPGDLPLPFQPARLAIAELLSLPLDQVQLASQEKVDWPDSCLGLPRPGGEVCSDVVVPGYQLIFVTPQGEFLVHTDRTGREFRLQPPVGYDPQRLPLVTWQRSGGIAGICQTLTVLPNGFYELQDCNNDSLLLAGPLPQAAWEKINSYLSRFAPFSYQATLPPKAADAFYDVLDLRASGRVVPDEPLKAEIDAYFAGLVSELAAAAAGGSGIQGMVLSGPACPGPERPGSPCPDQPVAMLFQVLDARGSLVSQFQSDAQGRFRLPLPPGSYVLHPVTSSPFPLVHDENVLVQTGKYTDLEIHFDSGIR